MSVAVASYEVAMEAREASPAHILTKIESYSLLHKCGIDKYETRKFDAGNYKWRLVIYPNGHGTEKDEKYVSLYLGITDTNSLPENWEVNVVFSICIFNQSSGSYLYTPGKAKRFFAMKTEWGFPKFISKELLTNSSNGYLIDDTCIFGAEVFVNENKAIIDRLSLKNATFPYKRDWKISNFSKLKDVWASDEFTADGRKWKIKLYPNGNGEETGRSLSIYLCYVNSKPCEKVKATYTICIKNQKYSDKHHKYTGSSWFEGPNLAWGWCNFFSLASLKDPNGGFIVKDSCVIEVEVSVLAVAQ